MRMLVAPIAAALCLLGSPASAHDKKRTDPCGCHHQYGMRHCHPKKKTPRCEAPVAVVPEAKRAADAGPPASEGEGSPKEWVEM